jgi:hypothetical protein
MFGNSKFGIGVLKHPGYNGKGGGSTQSTGTTYTTNIPEYAQPYVETMLGATQKQLFQGTTDAEGNYNITGFQPYTPYSANMQDYVAGFSPMQQQAFQGAANLQTPGQFAGATDLAGASGLGSLGVAGQAANLGQQATNVGLGGLGYGALGAGYGAMGAQAGQNAADIGQMGIGMGMQAYNQAANQGSNVANQAMGYGALGAGYGAGAADYGGLGAQAGQNAAGYGAMGAGYGAQAGQAGANFAQQATNPNAVQAYMNPYLQSSLAPQIEAMRRQYGITGTQQQSQATGAGAFGGSREALMAAENERAKNSAIDAAISQGYNTAFQNAQGQQQFGANLGLQGQQAAMQGAGMGITGENAAMQGAQTGISGMQAGMQGAQTGLSGLGQALSGYGLGLQGAQTGLQGLGTGITGQNAAMQGAQTGMQGAQTGLQGVGTALQGYGQGQAGLNTALQGLGQAGQAAGTLGQLGTQQLAAEQSNLGLQSQYGAQQQAQQQQMINQAIQDYATQQQYPMMQLGMMSNMLRGLPMQGVTTQSYQATPNALTQGIGALGTGLTLSNALGTTKAKGGVIKMAKGGIASYDVGGSVEHDLQDYSPEKLQEVIKSTQSETVRKLAKEVLQEKSYAPGGIIAFKEGSKDPIKSIFAGEVDPDEPSYAQELSGLLGAAPGENPLQALGHAISAETQKPGYGVLAAAKPVAKPVAKPTTQAVPVVEKPVMEKPAPAADRKIPATDVPVENKTPTPSAAYMPSAQTTTAGILAGAPQSIQDYMNKNPDTNETVAQLAEKRQRDKEAFLGPDTAAAEYRKSIMDQKANAKDEAERLQQMRLAEFFSVWGSTPGPTLVAGMKAAEKTIPNLIKDKDDQKKAKAELDKIIYGLDHATRLEKAGNWEEAAKEKEAMAKASQTWGGKWMDLASQASQNATSLQREEMANKSAEKRQAMGDAATVKAAGIRATADKSDANALKAQAIWKDVYNSALGKYSAIDPETADEKATAAADAALTPAQRETLGRGTAAAGPTTGSVVMDKSGKKVWQQH